MEGMDSFAEHPARTVALASMRAVEAGDREAWLALFAPDAVVADPIGPSPLDPTGQGHRGIAAIGAFYDNVVAQAEVRFVVRESYASGDECANVATITSTFPDGTVTEVDVVSTYRLDAEGRLAALRAYWEFDRLRVVAPPG